MGTVTDIQHASRKGRPPGKKSTRYTCSECGEQGHSKRTCPKTQLAEPEPTVKTTIDPETGEILDVQDVAEAEEAALESAGPLDEDGARAVVARVRARWDSLQHALAAQRGVNEEAKETLAAAEARFRNTVEAGTETGAPQDELVRKLRRVEMAWQDWQEEIARWKDAKGAAKDTVKAAKGMLKEVIENSRQMDLPGVASG
jgi:chromosome segregation ATPase